MPTISNSAFDIDILLVEENIVRQKLARKILEMFFPNLKLWIAPNGREGVNVVMRKAIQRQPLHVVLMRESMSVMGGLEATRLIRSLEVHHGLPRTPIIGIRSHVDVNEFLAAGMDHVINVPLRRVDLIPAIEDAYAKRMAVFKHKMFPYKL